MTPAGKGLITIVGNTTCFGQRLEKDDSYEEVIRGMKMRAGYMMSVCLLLLSCSGTRPSTLGVKDGMLSPCPDSPNCISTRSIDVKHAIKALDYSKTKAAAKEKLLVVISSFDRAEVIVNEGDYLHVEFASALFGFVDDVEFLFDDENKVIHFRSASRIGSWDIGANRRRMEKIRKGFLE